ncbi:MAG: B12-binding domain-containing radical SAM protein [Nitrospiraceae bacterium]|nr:B12-binding domain-containing radical SAM protein [Nitrospiraceae bacterium]
MGFISKKASYPPLGLLTVAAMLPEEWELRLVDMNVRKLRDKDIIWADYVFVSAMIVQADSVRKVLERCKSLGRKTVAGGPIFTTGHEEYTGVVDHFVLNEAEETLPAFLSDLKKGTPARMYTSAEWADLDTSPVPRKDLIKSSDYGAMNIQYSRGCPFDCEFCNITSLFGRAPRTKSKEQLIAELDSIHALGWKGCVFIVDDNFIGNKAKLKREILPAMIGWMARNNYPFTFTTEASINLADDEELMGLMVQAGFDTVFVGIESPNEDSLSECGKRANKGRDMIASIRKMQQSGLEVQGGFIVGFDNDPPDIFDRMISFIQDSSVVTAMVGMLNALPSTKLHNRLAKEGRLLKRASGNNTDFSINFIPSMDHDYLIGGYKRVIENIYSPKQYYKRVTTFLQNYRPGDKIKFHVRYNYVLALPKSIIRIGIFGRERFQYWKLFFWSLFRRPKLFPLAITFSIYGFHFRKMVKGVR